MNSIKLIFKPVALILLLLSSACYLTSCGDEDSDTGKKTNSSGDDFLVGEWKEIDSRGNFLDDATNTEVFHVKFYPNKTADFWSVTKGTKDKFSYSFAYSYTLNGTSGNITMTITASQNGPQVGYTETVPFNYEYGILDVGEISYKKIGGTDSGTGDSSASEGYTACPDSNHPHWIDLGIGTLWRCCNAGASTPEEYGGYYTFDQAQAYNPPTVEQIEALSNCSYTWTTQNGVAGGKFTGPNGGTIFLPAAGNGGDGGVGGVGSVGCYWSSTAMHGGGGEGNAYYLIFYSGKARGSSNGRKFKQSVRPVR